MCGSPVELNGAISDRPTWVRMSALVMKSSQRTPRIRRRHFVWKASSVFRSAESNFHVSAEYRQMERASTGKIRIFNARDMHLSFYILLSDDLLEEAKLIRLFRYCRQYPSDG